MMDVIRQMSTKWATVSTALIFVIISLCASSANGSSMQAAATFVPNPIKWVVVVGADSAIKDITSDDLKVLTGKTVCISPNSAGSILFQRRVTEQGVAIVSKYYENARLAYDALVNKKCDASVLPNTLLKQQGLGVVRPVFTLRNYYQKQGSIEA